MTAEQVLIHVNQKGIVLTSEGDRIVYKAPAGTMTPALVELIKTHKQAILSILNPAQASEYVASFSGGTYTRGVLPGDCDACPAGGFWDYAGPGMWCFHSALFLGKSRAPVSCSTARHDCPLKQFPHT